MTPSARPPTELIVALDHPTPERALACVEALRGLPLLLKVGSELFLAAGPEFVRRLTGEGARVFLDLKFHDIPHTVAKAARQAADLGVELFTTHLAGGPEMYRAIRSEWAELPAGRRPPRILGVTVLTSFSTGVWGEVCETLTGHARSPEASVLALAAKARAWGADGVVCSPHELVGIRARDPDLLTVVPGIRPAGADAQDQARVMTPGDAARAGATMIVVGRPITGASDPRAAAHAVLSELA